MANHFFGSSIQEHAEKDVKDTKPIDWVIFSSFFILFIGAFIAFFTLHIVTGIIMIGLFFMMFDVAARVIFNLKSKITPIFSGIGLLIILGGVLISIFGFWILMPYVFLCMAFVWLAIGIFCWSLGSKKRALRRRYSLEVEAECSIVDTGKVKVFRNQMEPVKRDHYATVNKPAFHYYVNGSEYFVESEVYYGDLNKDIKEGAKVKIFVDPSSPENFIPVSDDSVMETFMGVFGIVLGGGMLIAFSILMFLGIFAWY